MNDKDAIDRVTRRFFDGFTAREQRAPNIDELYELFLPQALIVKNVGGQTEVLDVGGFIEPRRKLLQSARFEWFEEREISESTSIFQNIAQRFSAYEKVWSESGERRSGAGTKLLQFVRAEGVWKIASLAWDDA